MDHILTYCHRVSSNEKMTCIIIFLWLNYYWAS